MEYGVYIGSKWEAERYLQKQLEDFNKPQCDTYERWKFLEGVAPFMDSLDTVSAAC
jgi:hypothetical protein